MAAGKAAIDAQSPRLSRGFTLVELAVVLGILALVLGALLPLFTAQAANARVSLTRAHQEAIRAALISYVGRHGYLPCPADGYLAATSSLYGHEARGAAVAGTPVLPPPLCTQLSTKAAPNPATSKVYDTASFNTAIPSVTVYRGVLPWLDLGLPEDVVNDGWNQRISYVVSSLGVSGYATREAISGMLGGLVMCNGTGSGSLLLTPSALPATQQATPNQPCTDSTNTKPLISTQSAAVALISHGENGYGAFVPPQNPASNNGGTVKPWGALASAAETANIDLGTNVLVQGGYSRSFDDIVLWLTPNDLTAPLIASGALPSQQGLLAQRLQAARAAVLAALASHQQALPQGGLQYYLCLPVNDSLGNPLFAGQLFNGGLAPGMAPNPAVLPAGSSTSASGWEFAYSGPADLANNPGARDPGDAQQVNHDPWGNPLLYSEMIDSAAATPPYALVFGQGAPLLPPGAGPISASYAFLLYSTGPDGLMGTADDGALAVSLDEVKAAMPTLPPAAQPDATNDRPAQYCP